MTPPRDLAAAPTQPAVVLDRRERTAVVDGVRYALRVEVASRGEKVEAFGARGCVWLLGAFVRDEQTGAVALRPGRGQHAQAHAAHLPALAAAWFDGALRCGPACDPRLPRPFVHVWVTHRGVRCCRVCGICWQRSGRQRACGGTVRITLRSAAGVADG